MKTLADRGKELAKSLAVLQNRAREYAANPDHEWRSASLVGAAFAYVRAIEAFRNDGR